MKRLVSIIAATAAAAAVAAAITLPAGADSGAKASQSDELAAFTSCLRAHGLAVPTGLEPVALKGWLGDHEGSASFEAAVNACEPHTEGPAKAPAPSPEELVTCLRDHGLDAPATIDQLKPWVLQQSQTESGKAALTACGFDARPVEKAHGGGGCAGDKAADQAKASRAKTSRAKASKAKAAPEL
jgi:hypothetical protein